MAGPNIRSMAYDFWRRIWPGLDLARAVRVEESGGETRVEIEDRIAHLRPRGGGSPRYRITTTRLALDPLDFPDGELRGRIGRAAAKRRNRALFCVDLAAGRVLAALSFHVDEDAGAPLLLRELLLAEGEEGEPAWRGALAAHLLLAYLAEAGARGGRGRRVGAIAAGAQEVGRLRLHGFREARRPDAFGPAGTYMEVEPPPRLPRF